MTKKELDALLAAKTDELKKTFKTEPTEPTVNASGLETLLKSDSDKPEVIALQKKADDIAIVSAILNGAPQGKVSPAVTNLKIYKSFMRDIETGASELLKAMTTGGSGSGSQWVPTGWSNQLQTLYELERKVAAALPSFNMPQNPFNYPTATSRTTMYMTAEAADATDSTIGTSYTTFTAGRLVGSCPVSRELEEDAIVDMLPAIKQDLATSAARAEENCLLNACTAATYDSDNSTGSDQRRIGWNGLRVLALANAYTTDIGTFNGDTINSMCKGLGVYYNPVDMFWVVGTSVWTQLRTLKDSANNALVITMDKLGPQATIKTGMVGELFGSLVYRSEFMRENLNTLGKYDASTTTKAGMLLVNKTAFKIGNRRGVSVQADYRPRTEVTDLVISYRQAFMPNQAIASNHAVHFGINITA